MFPNSRDVVKECSHSRRIDDGGFQVCTDCGNVFENIKTFEANTMTDGSQNYYLDTPATNPISTSELVLRQEILDVLVMLHQDRDYLAEQVIDFLKLHLSSPPDVTSMFPRGLVAFAIWEILNQNGCPHSPKHIAALCLVDVAVMLRAEKVLQVAPTYCKPSLYATRIVAELSLPRHLGPTLERIVETMDNFMHMPETIVGGVLLRFQDVLMAKRHCFLPKVITSQRVGDVLGVTAITLDKIRADLPPATISLMEQLAATIPVDSFISLYI